MKTRDEEIKQFALERNSDGDFDSNDGYQGLIEGAQWADEHPKNPWRDAKNDPLPQETTPLTPEILEKNGFVYADLPFEDFYEGYGLHIHGGNYADGYSNWYIICGTNVSMNVTHVHELQLALRLCGIEKEVVL